MSEPRTKSGRHVLALEDCPDCKNVARLGCETCKGAGKVSAFVVAEWELRKGKQP